MNDFDILADLSANGFITREQFVRKMDEMRVRWVVFNPYSAGPVMTNSAGKVCRVPHTWQVNCYTKVM